MKFVTVQNSVISRCVSMPGNSPPELPVMIDVMPVAVRSFLSPDIRAAVPGIVADRKINASLAREISAVIMEEEKKQNTLVVAF